MNPKGFDEGAFSPFCARHSQGVWKAPTHMPTFAISAFACCAEYAPRL